MPADIPCSARVADGAIRGGMVGALWVGYFGPRGDSWRAAAPAGGGALAAARAGALTVLGFAGFFGTYNGIFCHSQRAFGEGVATPLLSGACVGGTIGALMGGPPGSRGINMALCSASTALLCACSHKLVSAWKR